MQAARRVNPLLQRLSTFLRLNETAWQQERGVSGISAPSPSSLDQVMKLEELVSKERQEVADIWLQYHSDDSKNRVAGLLTASEYDVLQKRAKESPMFAVPLAKPGGGFLTLVLQCQMPFILFTTLQEYQQFNVGAPPHLTLTHYPELAASKDLVLVRGDIINEKVVSPAEARTLVQLTRAFYTVDDDYQMVYAFNHKQSDFDFDKLLGKLGNPHKTLE